MTNLTTRNGDKYFAPTSWRHSRHLDVVLANKKSTLLFLVLPELRYKIDVVSQVNKIANEPF